MKSFDFRAYTTENGSVVCCDCAGKLTEQEEKDKGYLPIFAGSEWDYYPCCDICGAEQDYVTLTEDGERFERLMSRGVTIE